MAASTSPQTQTIAEERSGFNGRESDALQRLTGEYRQRICVHRVPPFITLFPRRCRARRALTLRAVCSLADRHNINKV